jgi:predicted ATPase
MLVGREQEFAALRACMREAESGRGRTILVAGEPGVGNVNNAAIRNDGFH